MIDPWKGTLLGWIEDKETSHFGPKISQIISEEKIVYTHLAWNTAMNGTTCSVAIVIPTLVRKVKYESL